MNEEILAQVEASAPRRWIGVAMLAVLGAMLLWLALAQPPEGFGWRVFLLGVGALSIWVGMRMHQATSAVLILTASALRDSTGAVLAEVDQIEAIDRGAFAFKPSNGFMLKLSRKQPRRWMPGLWWRLGRRVGVGGVTPGSQTKAMAEIIQAMIAAR